MTNRLADRLQFVHAIHQERLWKQTFQPEYIHPLLWPCDVKILVVTDGALDFGLGNGGLRTFVEALKNNQPSFSRFKITVGHIEARSGQQIMDGEDAVVRSISQFKFDDTDHFTPEMYDVVFLFGHANLYSRPGYPNDRLGDDEIAAIEAHMARGAGVFATGDHGAIGKAMCASLPRVGSMRLWEPTSGDPNVDEVSMGGARRNDTNRPGANGTFEGNDQSDDVPQVIRPRMYRAWSGIWRYEFPHPVLCGKNGVIDVLPDHPHEGECVVPSSPSTDEYPEKSGVRPLPEIIAWADVLDGNDTGGFKAPAEGHAFGVICAYDGHPAELGRVVTDATWHHFVNMNLIGVGGPPGQPTESGFLFSASGQEALDKIFEYYVNLAIWLCPEETINCIRVRQLWLVAFHQRVLEATVNYPSIGLEKANVGWLWAVGKHARDALGKETSACQSRELIHWIIQQPISLEPTLMEQISPWAPKKKLTAAQLRRRRESLPWVDMEPLLDLALGGAVTAITEQFNAEDREKVRDGDIMEVAAKGAAVGLELGSDSLTKDLREASRTQKAFIRSALTSER